MTSLAREAESCMWSERFFEDILRAYAISDDKMDVTHTTYVRFEVIVVIDIVVLTVYNFFRW